MADTDLAAQPDLTALTVQLLSAYVANNSVASGDLAELIRSTRSALEGPVAEPTASEASAVHVPAVSIRKSTASRDHILSLIDGKPYKTLKRHLAGHGLTPEEYRARYNLPKSYPMVAPSYSQRRREVAEQLGLGRKRKEAVVAAPAVAPVVAERAAPAAPAAKPKRTPRRMARTAPETPAVTSAPAKAPAKSPASPTAAKPQGTKIKVETPKVATRKAKAKPTAAATPKPRGRAKKVAPEANSQAAE